MRCEAVRDLETKIKPPMSANEALIEASRCLFCYDAPCTIACPSAIDVPMFIRQIAGKNNQGAAKTIFTQNILGASCGAVCPTEVLCEGSCVYHGLNEKPIDIGRLQASASNFAIENKLRFFEKGAPTHRKVAIIGSGPAGLSCAHELTKLGHEVVVYESSANAGGLNRYGVAPYKFNNEEADREVNYISGIGFEIRTGMRVVAETSAAADSTQISLRELEAEFDAIFLATGLGQSRRLGLEGEDLPGVYGAAEFIYELRENNLQMLNDLQIVGSRVVVIGAGNTAIDAAVESAMLGAQVTMAYHRRAEDQSAYAFEVAHARQAGVAFRYLVTPVKILGDQRVEGLLCMQNEVQELPNSHDKKGKAEIRTISGSEFVLPCETVIFATGQEKMTAFYEQIPALALNGGKVSVNEQFQTGNPKYFAGGDCVNGGREVVHAVAHGRDAARGLHRYLMGENA
jgi:dihydropyrimidine dehydrogenase (NAD+) subunit PreT